MNVLAGIVARGIFRLRTFSLVTLALLVLPACQLQAQPAISTIAGRTRHLLGVGGPASQLSLADPVGITTDAAGNVYIADDVLNIVFKVKPGGTASIYAGSQIQGFSGDGGPAVNATFNQPYALATDSKGDLYISDFRNGRIREVDPSGTITTVAGSGSACCSLAGPAGSATIFEPSGLATDVSGNVYISLQSNHVIAELTNQGQITVVAGTYQPGSQPGFSGDGGLATGATLSLPVGLRVDSSGNLYFADRSNNRIRKISTDGLITTLAGNGQGGYTGDNGPATSASLTLPTDVAFDPAGNLYICDQYNNVVRKVDSHGIISTVAGNGRTFSFSGDGGPAAQAALNLPYSIAVDSHGNLFINDYGNRRVRMVDTTGTITTIAGNGASNYSGDGGPATSADLDEPASVAVDSAGNIYIADTGNQRIRMVDQEGTITTVAGNGTAGFSGDGGAAVNASFNYPSYVAVDAAGNLWIADEQNIRVRKVNASDGTIQTVAGNGGYGFSGDGGNALNATFGFPAAVRPAPDGSFYVADRNNNRVRKVGSSGIITTVAGNGQGAFSGDGGQATQASLSGPRDLALDQAGNLYIADSYNFRIRKVTPAGVISTVMGCGSCSGSFGPAAAQLFLDSGYNVAADNFGNIYASASFSIVKANSLGNASVVIDQSGVPGYSGDGGPATQAEFDCIEYLYACNRLALDAQSNLYLADTGNDRIRRVTNPTAPSQIGISNGPFDGLLDVTLSFDPNSTPEQGFQVINLGTGVLTFQASAKTDDGNPWLKVSPSSATAPAQATVVVDVGSLGVGTHNGTVTISSPAASNSPEVIPVVVNIPGTPPSVNSGGVVSASAFGEFGSVAPGSWIEIYGTALAAATQEWSSSDFNGLNAPTNLGGTSVTIGGQSAFVDYISPSQVNVQVPGGVNSGAQSLVVTTAAGAGAPFSVTVDATEPGLLAPSNFNVGGTQYVVAQFADGSYVLPPGAIAGLTSQRAQPGDELVIYGIGFGSVTPNIPPGQLVGQLNTLAMPFTISFGGTQAPTVPYDGLAPNYMGLYQFNVVVPTVAASDTVPLTFTLGGVSGTQMLSIAIGN